MGAPAGRPLSAQFPNARLLAALPPEPLALQRFPRPFASQSVTALCEALFGIQDDLPLTLNIPLLACNAALAGDAAFYLTAREIARKGPAEIEAMRERNARNPFPNPIFEESDADVWAHWAASAWFVSPPSLWRQIRDAMAKLWRVEVEGEPLGEPIPPPPESEPPKPEDAEAVAEAVFGAPLFATRRGAATFPLGPPSIVDFGLFPPREWGLA